MRWAGCHAAPDGSGAPPHGIYFAAAVTLIAGKRATQDAALAREGFLSLAQSVRATLTPFPTLLEGLSHEDGAGTFFTSVRAGLSCGQTLANAWRAAARTLPLAEREKETVAALGGALGGEEESVCAALTHAARELSDAERSLFARSREEGRVMTALCLGGGTLLGILLL